MFLFNKCYHYQFGYYVYFKDNFNSRSKAEIKFWYIKGFFHWLKLIRNIVSNLQKTKHYEKLLVGTYNYFNLKERPVLEKDLLYKQLFKESRYTYV